ncbi:MAG: efflux RND transporter periplasmic adaptor subunit [Oceanobacter sp.]
MSSHRFSLTPVAGAVALATLLPATAAADSPLEIQVVSQQTVPVYYDLEATLEAVNESTISAQTSGAIKAVHYDVNDRVKAGTLLIEIDDTQQQAALAQAKANLAKAEAQNEDAQILLKRNKRLLKQGSVSQGQYDSSVAQAKSAEAAVAAAKAAVRQAKEQLSYTRVKAPYGGIVKGRMVEVGELVNPGQPMMSGLALQPLRAIADVPQRLANQYQGDSSVQVVVNGQPVDASKVTLYPYADTQHHSIRLRAELPANADIKAIPGMWAKVRLQTGDRTTLLIPESAIIERSELTAVYIMDGNTPKLRQVRLGNGHNDQREVLAGLNTGEQLILDGYAAMASLASGKATDGE